MLVASAAAGVALGVAYALSPLTVWFAVIAVLLLRWARQDLDPIDRHRVTALLAVAILVRLAAVAGLFALTDHRAVAFRTFFGDEEFFVRRAIWLRNIALGLPIHSADLIYSFDQVGETSYLYFLAAIQVLVGPSPYGVHLVAIGLYLAATILLFRIAYVDFGRMPALLGLVGLLFLPSLFAWSISALKEPAFFLLSALSIAGARQAVRARTIPGAIRNAAMVLVLLGIAESVRRAGSAILAIGLALGLAAAFIVPRPRWLLGVALAAPIAIGAVASRPAVQIRLYTMTKQAAWQHTGHILTPGYVYKTLGDRFYRSEAALDDMRADEASRFLANSIVAYAAAPLPWQVQSRAMLAYMPEQLVWYGMLLALPAGLLFSLRRNPLLASLLSAEAIVAAVLVAITGGNIGTLVRHRGMAIPYIVWLSAVGACELLSRAVGREPSALAAHPFDALQKTEPTCP